MQCQNKKCTSVIIQRAEAFPADGDLFLHALVEGFESCYFSTGAELIRKLLTSAGDLTKGP